MQKYAQKYTLKYEKHFNFLFKWYPKRIEESSVSICWSKSLALAIAKEPSFVFSNTLSFSLNTKQTNIFKLQVTRENFLFWTSW